METATVVRFYPNAVWIETDVLGDAHVMLQSEAPGCEPECVATIRYVYPFVDNGTRMRLAERVAEMMGATLPVDVRIRAPNAEVTRADGA